MGTPKNNYKEIEIPLKSEKTRAYRFFEMVPGIISWVIILAMIPFSYFRPDIYSYFIVFYILSWVIRSFLMTIKTYIGYKIIKSVDEGGVNKSYKASKSDLKIKQAYFNLLDKNKSAIRESEIINSEDIRHIVVVPVYNESYEMVKKTLDFIVDSKYDINSKVLLVLTYEARTGESVEGDMVKLKKEFEAKFMAFILNKHELKEDEVPGKGANISSCDRIIINYCKSSNIKYKNVLVTTLDADNRVSDNYFSTLDRVYCSTKNPMQTSLQPVAIYTNNIWRVPAIARMQAINNTIWSVAQSIKPRVMRNFSSHAQSLDSLVATNFWSKRTIVEDGHQYWRSLAAFEGDYRVVPFYSSIGQDAVETDRYGDIFKAQFTQLRRWSYGASDIPYVLTVVLPLVYKNNPRKIMRTLGLTLRLFDTHINWATNSFIILLAPMLPVLMRFSGRYDALSSRLPAIISNIQSFALISLAFIVVFNFIILPKDANPKSSRSKKFLILLQWAASPLVGIIYGSGASLYSQTRLMLGKYYEAFDVTDKKA
jgi:hypothetical protein